MKLNELENIISIDIKGSLARFGNMESFYVKYLKKFIEDKNFENIVEGIANRDDKLIKESAHTLKGIAGNLGLIKIFEISTELMRVEDLSKERVKILINDLEQEMKSAREVLAKLD